MEVRRRVTACTPCIHVPGPTKRAYVVQLQPRSATLFWHMLAYICIALTHLQGSPIFPSPQRGFSVWEGSICSYRAQPQQRCSSSAQGRSC